MQVRKVTADDRENVISSFKPLFGDWDYLPLVFDEWLDTSKSQATWVACIDKPQEMLISMAHAYELEPGDWYLCALRSNPDAKSTQVGTAILAISRAILRELTGKGIKTARFLTSTYFPESIKLAPLLGFREHFRQVMDWHPVPEKDPQMVEGISVSAPDNAEGLFKYFLECKPVKSMEGYFCTEWDTRQLRIGHLEDALSKGILRTAVMQGEMVGAAMYYKYDWLPSIVHSLVEGTDEALRALYRDAVIIARERGCDGQMLMHITMDELKRRQRLFGIEERGVDVISYIWDR